MHIHSRNPLGAAMHCQDVASQHAGLALKLASELALIGQLYLYGARALACATH
jgi:hypothetical protein